MNLALNTTMVQAELPFAQASSCYQQALSAIEFPPNAVVDPKLAVSDAIANVTRAIELLEPALGNPDPFVRRPASASIDAATRAVASLETASGTIDYPGSQISFEQLVSIARNGIAAADQALWAETVGG